jgi:hypothetical protein
MAALSDSTEKLGMQALLELLEEAQQQAVKHQASLAKMLQQHQDSLADIQDSLVPLVEGLKKERDLGLLLADVRDGIADAGRLMQEQWRAVLHRLDEVTRPAVPVSPPGWHRWVLGGCAGVLLLGGVAAWWCWPDSRYTALARGLDSVLAQRYSVLPGSVQEQVNALYGQVGFASPGQRQKGK